MNSVNEKKKRVGPNEALPIPWSEGRRRVVSRALLSPFYRSAEALERRDQHAKPKAKAAKGPMRPEHDDVRMKPGLGLKRQPKQRQGLLTNHFKKKKPVVAAEPETIDLS